MDKIYFFSLDKYLINSRFGLILKSVGNVSKIPTYLKVNSDLWFHNNILIKKHSKCDLIINNHYNNIFINDLK
jgi:hypothetical protein